MRGALLRVELLGAPELVALVARARAGPNPSAPTTSMVVLRVDVVGGRAAEPRDERTRVLAAERAQFSGEDDELTGERLTA